MWFFRKKRRTFVVRIQGGTPGTGQRRCHGKNKVQGPDVTPQCGNPPLFHMLFQFSKGWCPWSNSSTFAGGKTPEFAEFFSGSSFGLKWGHPQNRWVMRVVWVQHFQNQLCFWTWNASPISIFWDDDFYTLCHIFPGMNIDLPTESLMSGLVRCLWTSKSALPWGTMAEGCRFLPPKRANSAPRRVLRSIRF